MLNHNTITNSPAVIVEAIESETEVEFLSRQRMTLMASFNLGKNWEEIAAGPTLFIIVTDHDDQIIDILAPGEE